VLHSQIGRRNFANCKVQRNSSELSFDACCEITGFAKGLERDDNQDNRSAFNKEHKEARGGREEEVEDDEEKLVRMSAFKVSGKFRNSISCCMLTLPNCKQPDVSNLVRQHPDDGFVLSHCCEWSPPQRHPRSPLVESAAEELATVGRVRQHVLGCWSSSGHA